MSERTFVYIIGQEDGPIKVGITSNLLSRLRAIQTASPYKIDLIYVFTCPTRDEAVKMEQWFHEVHASDRMEGEWFNMDALSASDCLTEQVNMVSPFFAYWNALYDKAKAAGLKIWD